MLLVRKPRVTVLPLISLAAALVLTAALVQQTVVAGESVGRLAGIGLLVVVFFGYAIVTVCRLERRGPEVSWGRLRLLHREQASRCAVRGTAYANVNGGFLAIELLAKGQPVLQVTVMRQSAEADARA